MVRRNDVAIGNCVPLLFIFISAFARPPFHFLIKIFNTNFKLVTHNLNPILYCHCRKNGGEHLADIKNYDAAPYLGIYNDVHNINLLCIIRYIIRVCRLCVCSMQYVLCAIELLYPGKTVHRAVHRAVHILKYLQPTLSKADMDDTACQLYSSYHSTPFTSAYIYEQTFKIDGALMFYWKWIYR